MISPHDQGLVLKQLTEWEKTNELSYRTFSDLVATQRMTGPEVEECLVALIRSGYLELSFNMDGWKKPKGIRAKEALQESLFDETPESTAERTGQGGR